MTYQEVLESLGNDKMGFITGKDANAILKYYRSGMKSAVLTPTQAKGLKVLESWTR